MKLNKRIYSKDKDKDKDKDIDLFYSNCYEELYGTGVIGKLIQRIHSQLDKPFQGLNALTLIEVGSGNSQHFMQTSLGIKRYLEIDIREKNSKNISFLLMQKNGWEFLIDNANYLKKISENSFDGLIATCLLAHLENIEIALENWKRVVRPGGIISIYVPHEPGILLRFARKFSTRKKILAQGYDYDYVHWKEHRNHYPAMRTFVYQVFINDEIKKKSFPLNFLPWDLNLYSIFYIKKGL